MVGLVALGYSILVHSRKRWWWWETFLREAIHYTVLYGGAATKEEEEEDPITLSLGTKKVPPLSALPCVL